MSQDVIFKLRREENCEHNIILTENMQNTRMWLKKKNSYLSPGFSSVHTEHKCHAYFDNSYKLATFVS